MKNNKVRAIFLTQNSLTLILIKSCFKHKILLKNIGPEILFTSKRSEIVKVTERMVKYVMVTMQVVRIYTWYSVKKVALFHKPFKNSNTSIVTLHKHFGIINI